MMTEVLQFILKVWIYAALMLLAPAISMLFFLHRNLSTFLDPDVLAGFAYVFQSAGLL